MEVKDGTPKFRKVREEPLNRHGGNPLGFYQCGDSLIVYLVGDPLFEEMGFNPGRVGLETFIRDNLSILDGLVRREKINHVGQMQEMCLLHEDAVNIAFSSVNNALSNRMQLEFNRIVREIRQTNASPSPNNIQKLPQAPQAGKVVIGEAEEKFEIGLFEEMFGSIGIEFAIDQDGTKTISILSVARALEYGDPWSGYSGVLKRNEEYFEGEVKDYYHGDSTKKFLTRKGLDLFLLFSGQPKAKEFKVWVAGFLEEKREESTDLDKRSTASLLAEADERSRIVLRRHDGEIHAIKNRLGSVEETIQELPMTETHKEELGVLVNQLHIITEKPRKTIWTKLNTEFNVPKPSGNRSWISLALDSQYESMKDYLKDWIRRETSQRTLDF